MPLWTQAPGSQEISQDLRAALELVLGDLQGASPIDVRVKYTGSELWFLEPDGLGAAFGWWDESPARLLVNLADYLQEQFFPETREAWGEARPPCPGHTHPAAPDLIDGEPWWKCPASGERVARFGTLRG
jgi:hypothetical protein